MSDKVLVSDKVSEDGLAVFRDAGIPFDYVPEISQEEIKERIGDYTGWVIRSRSRATADIIERAAKLRVIGRAGVGVDNVDTEAATRRGIIVMNTPGGNTISTAEHTIAMMLSMARRIPQAAALLRQGKWDKKNATGVEFNGKVLGVLGLGRLGQEVVRRMKAFDMQVLGYDPFVSSERMRQLGVEGCTVDEICKRADFITVHTPLSPETKDLINADRIGMMKKTCRIVNCARGGIINEKDLADALRAGRIAGAALDVFVEEPLPAGHPFEGLDNAVLTPHIAASTTEAQENVALEVARQIADLLKGRGVRNALNVPSVDPELLPVVGPYMDLAEKLGCFLSQFHRGRAVRLTCHYSGAILEFPVSIVTTSAVIGFVKLSSDGNVNQVNAMQVLKDRGIELVESKHSETFQYTNLISIEAQYEDGAKHRISGTLFSPKHPRIVIVNGKHFDTVPTGNLIVIENDDVPGIIGNVGTFFGKNGINIGQMTWGRVREDGTAMTIINVDTEVTEEMLAQIRALPNIKSAALIRL